jgi:hypothetical protein
MNLTLPTKSTIISCLKILAKMGWSALCLHPGLRLRSLEDSSNVRAAIQALGKDAETKVLRLRDLSPSLKNSEMGNYGTNRNWSHELEETYERCCEAEGCSLLFYVNLKFGPGRIERREHGQ